MVSKLEETNFETEFEVSELLILFKNAFLAKFNFDADVALLNKASVTAPFLNLYII